MKRYNYVIMIILAISVSLVLGCKETNGLRPEGGSWSSAALQGYIVKPINGGAEISYEIPNDPDILYIMAEYERNGKTYTEKSSVHKNVLTIEGFHQVDRVKATLYKVNRKEERSAPVEIEFEPLESVIDVATRTLDMNPAFGGVLSSWENPLSTSLGVRFMKLADDGTGIDYEEMYFSATAEERRTFRQFDATPATFAISFEDKWGNVSDTTYTTMTPLFETMIPKPYADFRGNIPFDNTTNYSAARTFSNLWDGIVNTSGHGWLTISGNSGLSITFDMKQVAKLSRIVIHGYHVNAPYGQANITKFEVWGTDEIPSDRFADRPYWMDEQSVREGRLHGIDRTTELPERTFKDDWEYLGSHAITRYDLMTPPDPQGTANISQNGSEYEIPLSAKPVRYIRIFPREIQGAPPTDGNYFSMGEITFYGDNSL